MASGLHLWIVEKLSKLVVCCVYYITVLVRAIMLLFTLVSVASFGCYPTSNSVDTC